MHTQWVEGQAFNESNMDKAVGATIFWSGVIQFFQCLYKVSAQRFCTAVKFQFLYLQMT